MLDGKQQRMQLFTSSSENTSLVAVCQVSISVVCLGNIGQDGKGMDICKISLLKFFTTKLFYQSVFVVMPQQMEFDL